MQNENMTINNKPGVISESQKSWLKSKIREGKYITVNNADRVVTVNFPTGNFNVDIPRNGASAAENLNFKLAWTRVYDGLVKRLEYELTLYLKERKVIKSANDMFVIDGVSYNFPEQSSDCSYAEGIEEIVKACERATAKYNNMSSSYKTSVYNGDFTSKYGSKINLDGFVKGTSEFEENIYNRPVSVTKRVETIDMKDVSNDTASLDFPKKGGRISFADVPEVTCFIAPDTALGDGDLPELKEKSSNGGYLIISCPSGSDFENFNRNVNFCNVNKIPFGIFIDGKIVDLNGVQDEVKRITGIIKKVSDLLSLSNHEELFIRFIIYADNDTFIIENANDMDKLIEYVKGRNMVAAALGSLKIDVVFQCHWQNVGLLQEFDADGGYDRLYWTPVRDAGKISEQKSVVISDPNENYDVAHIKNRKVISFFDEMMSANRNIDRSLAVR